MLDGQEVHLNAIITFRPRRRGLLFKHKAFVWAMRALFLCSVRSPTPQQQQQKTKKKKIQ